MSQAYLSKKVVESVLLGYQIKKSLHKSGCAETFLANYKGEDVVLKVFKSDFPIKRRDRERDMMQKINHKNVVKFIDYDHKNSGGVTVSYMTVELINGLNLIEKRQTGWKPNNQEVLNLLEGYVDGLKALSSKQIIHRDIKPGNLMIKNDDTPVIIDLGVARDYQRQTIITEYSRWHPGTLPYMSPEQIEGRDLDIRSDFFSLGIALFETITGQHPFGDLNDPDITDKITDPQVIAPRITKFDTSIPSAIANIFEKLLKKKIIDRYRRADDLLRDIKSARGSLMSPKQPLEKGSYFLHVGSTFNYLDDLFTEASPDGLLLSTSSLRPTGIKKITKGFGKKVKHLIIDPESYRTVPTTSSKFGIKKFYTAHPFTQHEEKTIENITAEEWSKQSDLRKTYISQVINYQVDHSATIILPPYLYIDSVGNGTLQQTIRFFREAQQIAILENLQIENWVLGVLINGSEVLEESKRDELLTSITAVDTNIVYLQIDAKTPIDEAMMSKEILAGVEIIIRKLEENDIQVILGYVDWEGFGFISRGLSAVASGTSSGKRSMSVEAKGFSRAEDQERIERFDLQALMCSLRHPGELDFVVQRYKDWKKIRCDCKFCAQQPIFNGQGETITGKLKDAHSALLKIRLSKEMKELTLEGKKEFFNDLVIETIANHRKLEDERLFKPKGKSSSVHLKRWLEFVDSTKG